MRKYILEREDKIYLPDREKEQPKKRIFREKTEKKQREIRKFRALVAPGSSPYPTEKKIVFRVFIFF